MSVCSICKNQLNQYICPKCNVHYCSLNCYKVHSKDCTNLFYQERIVENLKIPNTKESLKVETLEMLKNIEKEKIETNLDEKDIQLLSNLDLSKDISLNDLPENLQKDFKDSLKDGRISTWLKIWIPWWVDNPKIIEIKIDEKQTKIPSFSELSRNKEPNIALTYGLVDMIYAYCYTERITNGEALSMIDESKKIILILSGTLGNKEFYKNIEHSISKSLENSRNHEIFDSIEFSLSIINDVILILTSKDFTIKSLSNLELIFNKDKLVEKKIIFYKSFVDSYHDKLYILEEMKEIKEKQEEINKK